jgi:hypothetical protein
VYLSNHSVMAGDKGDPDSQESTQPSTSLPYVLRVEADDLIGGTGPEVGVSVPAAADG